MLKNAGECLLRALIFLPFFVGIASAQDDDDWFRADKAEQEQNNVTEVLKTVGSPAYYQIQPGDVLHISVWKEPDLQSDIAVRPDGGITFPLIGELQAKGKSVTEIRDEIAGTLEKYIPDPVVTVAAKQLLGNKIYILGQVNRPGELVLNRRVDVMQALSMAGGTTAFAHAGDIKILRRNDNGQAVMAFNYDEIVKGRHLEQNVVLQTGDVVVVP